MSIIAIPLIFYYCLQTQPKKPKFLPRPQNFIIFFWSFIFDRNWLLVTKIGFVCQYSTTTQLFNRRCGILIIKIIIMFLIIDRQMNDANEIHRITCPCMFCYDSWQMIEVGCQCASDAMQATTKEIDASGEKTHNWFFFFFCTCVPKRKVISTKRSLF